MSWMRSIKPFDPSVAERALHRTGGRWLEVVWYVCANRPGNSAPRPGVVAYSFDGCCTLAADRSAPETGVDLANPWRVRLTSQGGRDLLVAEDVARAHNHWKSLRPQEHDECPHPHERDELDTEEGEAHGNGRVGAGGEMRAGLHDPGGDHPQ